MFKKFHSIYQQRSEYGGHGKGRCNDQRRSQRQHDDELCQHSYSTDKAKECCRGRGNETESNSQHHHHDYHDKSRGKQRSKGCDPRGKGRGRQLKRMFDHGDLRVLLLSMIAKKPSHGYEIIRDIDEASSGLYVPSPGVIYPTLTLLEEQDLLIANIAEKGRKNYSITPEGKQFLTDNLNVEKNIQMKLSYARDLSQNTGGVSEQIETAVGKLKAVLRHKLVLKELSTDKAERIASILNQAVEQIEAINEALIAEEREDE